MNSTDPQYDVLIVGAGLAGGAMARQLTAGGAKVLMLEQGPSVLPMDTGVVSPDWQFDMVRRWASDPNVRKLDADYPITGGGFQVHMFNAVGGSTNAYGALWHRMKPSDFVKGTEHGLGETIDWPFSYDELVPYYDEHDRRYGISGLAGDPSYPELHAHRFPPIRHGGYVDVAAKGFEELGWHWWPADVGSIAEDYDGRQGCNLCGYCATGCPRESKGTATNAHIRHALRNGLELRTGARVTRILTQGRRAIGAEYIDRDTGAMHAAYATVVVVACNGIGTPRLLLMSANSDHPDGLANDHDQVGRNLILHGYSLVDIWTPGLVEPWKGPMGSALYSHQFYDTDESRGFVNGMTLTVVGAGGALLHALGGMQGSRPADWGAAHHEQFLERFGHNFTIAIQTDDIPSPENRITLDPSVTDSSGLPAARRSYTLHENDRRALEFGRDRVREFAAAIGGTMAGGEIEPYYPPGWHLMGSNRIGTSPHNSVADSWHRAWGVENLVICDAGSMPTGGGVNPSSTIGAMGIRCADGLLSAARSGSAVKAEMVAG